MGIDWWDLKGHDDQGNRKVRKTQQLHNDVDPSKNIESSDCGLSSL